MGLDANQLGYLWKCTGCGIVGFDPDSFLLWLAVRSLRKVRTFVESFLQ